MRSPKYVLAVALACAVVAVPSALVIRQDVTLRYTWTKGETLRYRLTQRTTSTMSGVPGSEGGMTVEKTLSQVWKKRWKTSPPTERRRCAPRSSR